MRASRRLAVLATALCAAALAIAAGGASAKSSASLVLGADGTTAPVYSYQDAIRERVFVPVPGVDQDNDGTTDRVAVDIVRPQETSSGLKVPAIIDPSPYYTSLGRGNESQYIHTTAAGVLDKFPLYYDNYFVPRGYAFIAAQAVGTAFSTGCPLQGGPGDIAGMKAVIDWLMGRTAGFDAAGNAVTASWNSGKNAMIGKSYDGTFANGVASTGVDGLTTIVPISAISDWYDYSRMGGIRFNNHYPASLSSTITQNQGATQLGVVPPNRNTLCLASRNAMSAVGTQGDGDADGDVDDFWQGRDYNLNVGHVHASVLVSHGLNDDNVRPDHFARWWAGLSANNVPRKLWLSQLGHVDPFDYRRAAWVDTLHRWFDYWLQDVPNGIMSEPQVDIETPAGTWETHASWPVPTTTPLDVYLQGTAAGAPGALALSSGGNSDTLTFVDNNLSEANYSSLTVSQANRLLFLTPPLTHDLRISGTPVVDIRASLSTTQSNLSAILVDYGTGVSRVGRAGSDGISTTATRTCWGENSVDAGGNTLDSACYLETTQPTQTPSQWRVSKGILDSTNRDSLFTGLGSPTVIGQTYEFRWPTLPNDFTFLAGHRIGIVIGATFTGYSYVTNPANGTRGATITVDTKASKVILPVVGGAQAAIASGGFDTAPPTLHLPANIVTEATGATTPVTYSATVTDDLDPSPTIVCAPASGSAFPLGTTTVSCTGTDASGKTSTGTFDVRVVDTTAPHFAPAVDVTAEATSASGATVSYAAPAATDLVDGAVAPVCAPASGSVFPLGATAVACTATDAAGNVAHATLTVTVRDTTGPALTAPASLVVNATTPTGGRATWTATATDAVDSAPVVACTPASGSLFPIGDTTVTCTATDASHNVTSKSFTVHVNGVAEQVSGLRTLVTSSGLDAAITTDLLGQLSLAEKAIDRNKDACRPLDELVKHALDRVANGDPAITVAQAKALVAAANALSGTLACRAADSAVPAAQQDLLDLIDTLDGMTLAAAERTALANQARNAAKQLAGGSGACGSLADLAQRIADDVGKGKLTAAQAAQLSAAVASIRGHLGCS